MSPRTTRVAGWILAVSVMGVCTALGVWQVSRMHEKRAMLEAVDAVLARRDARPLAAAHAPEREGAYDWAAGEGRFVDAPAFVLDNQIHESRPGLRIYRLFQPATGAAPLLVDLGWTPLVDRTTRMPAADVVAGEGLLDTPVAVRGLLAPPPSSGLALGPALAEGSRLMTRFDAGAIAAAAGLQAPPRRVLRLDPALPLGYARDLDVLPNTLPPDKHLGYAVQWFGLALAALVTALVLTFRRPRR
ncbi:SURF1 family protein [Luteimonas deserti]|uniref:SURF1-like protein n=1 Tax=Luteimonas deserti TaxID=2752306 RepID=A0A7Z0TUS5_9GAMM|nr:SURF1 family protein [Luteimonas deserti]NYZ61474.1 SURF1 family protein [Luteimonas deserti]